jgi:hypothetical protein
MAASNVSNVSNVYDFLSDIWLDYVKKIVDDRIELLKRTSRSIETERRIREYVLRDTDFWLRVNQIEVQIINNLKTEDEKLVVTFVQGGYDNEGTWHRLSRQNFLNLYGSSSPEFSDINAFANHVFANQTSAKIYADRGIDIRSMGSDYWEIRNTPYHICVEYLTDFKNGMYSLRRSGTRQYGHALRMNRVLNSEKEKYLEY